jgi:predicted nucleotidyltransferase
MLVLQWEKQIGGIMGKVVLMVNPHIQTIITQTSQGLKNLYGEQLDQLLLFGSQARGDAKADSDIDILIVLKNSFDYSKESDKISHFIANLCLEYNILISCAFATHEQLQNYNNAFFRNIRREGVVI